MTEQEQVETIKSWLSTGSINIFGPPFAGKDTQGGRLAELFHTPLIGGGDILRNSVIPDHVKDIMHRGGLVPIEDYLQIVLPYLSRDELAGRPLVLSSVGRWSGEERSVIEALKQSNHTLKAVVHITLEERLIWRRWEADDSTENRGQRHDDAADSLERRLEEFSVKTLPVIEFYKDLGLVIEISGDQPVEAVWQEMLSRLANRAAATP